MLNTKRTTQILGNILTVGLICIYAILWTMIIMLVSHVAVQIVVYFV
mgnify:FL=1